MFIVTLMGRRKKDDKLGLGLRKYISPSYNNC